MPGEWVGFNSWACLKSPHVKGAGPGCITHSKQLDFSRIDQVPRVENWGLTLLKCKCAPCSLPPRIIRPPRICALGGQEAPCQLPALPVQYWLQSGAEEPGPRQSQ